MVKLCGVLLLLGCGVWGGIALRAFLVRRCRQCEAFLALMRTVRAQIDCFSAPMDKILAGCDKKILADCGWPAGPRPRNLRALLDGCRLYLPEEACAILAEFAAQIGGNYREEELRCCEYHTERLTPIAKTLRAQLTRRERVAMFLPPALSALVVLLLL